MFRLTKSQKRSPLEEYQKNYSDTEGFFVDNSKLVWDFLLNIQAQNFIEGNFFEIGVYKGKSAYLGALHLKPQEKCILVDFNPEFASITNKMRADLGSEIIEVGGLRSDNPNVKLSLQEYAGTVRFFHIDGEHSGYSTYNDLLLADFFLGDRGIICVDDFANLRYPQLLAAVYRFLDVNAQRYLMVLCGGNKCYIVKKTDYAFYESIIRTGLMPHLFEHGQSCLLSKSSYIFDGGCFSLMDRFIDRDYLGRDEDNNDLPF